MQFNDELVYLEGIWSGEKINLIYVQALQKISKYIYQKKANSHPNAIKLLLKLYYNLEKIISDEDLTSEQKRDILLEDIKRFEGLKRLINQQTQGDVSHDGSDEDQGSVDQQINENELLNLKATVLGIDWEITEEDLNNLRQEVVRLEEKYADSRPKLILLQGIGTLGAYIKVNRSDAHGDAFKLLHLFFESLEKIVKTPMSLEEEKAVLFPTIEEFNAFKTMIDSTSTSAAVDGEGEEGDEDNFDVLTGDSGEIKPALADFEEGESRGFQEEEEAKRLGDVGLIDVSSHIDKFFGSDPEEVSIAPVEEDFEVQSVDDSNFDDFESASDDVDLADVFPAVIDDAEDTVAGGAGILPAVDRDLALQGVDVETDADDDSDEEALPVEGSGVLVPALGDSDQASVYSVDSLSASPAGGSVDEKIHKTLDNFFVDEEESGETVVEDTVIESEPGIGAGIDVSSVDDEGAQLVTDGEGVLPIIDEEEALDDTSIEVESNLDAFFGVEQESEVEDELEMDGVETEAETSGVDEEEVIFELVRPTVEENESDELVEVVPDVLSDTVLAIGQYIDALNLNFDEEIIGNLNQEINQLQQHWVAKKPELSLVQLLSTVTLYIDRFRFDSDQRAYEMLQSNYAALELFEEGTVEKKQEVLFNEMSKVLKWQQDLLFEQIMPE